MVVPPRIDKMLLYIYTLEPDAKNTVHVQKLVAKYGALVSVVSFVLAFIYLVASPSKSGGAKAGKKRR
jgi:translocon-associated protein subunit beta